MLVEFEFEKQIFQICKAKLIEYDCLFSSIAHRANVGLFHLQQHTSGGCDRSFWKRVPGGESDHLQDHKFFARKLCKSRVTTLPLHLPGKAAKLTMQHICFQ